MKVWLRIPTNQAIDPELSRWWGRFAAKELDVDVDLHWSNRGPDRARNEIIRDFLDSDAERLWLMDRDVVPMAPKKVINIFLTSRFPVLSGVTDIYSGKLAYPQVYHKQENGPYSTVIRQMWPKDDFFATDAVAAGCLVVQRSVFEGMEDPWFEFQGPRAEKGEDLYFCEKAGGAVVYQPMLCRHYKEVDLSGLRLLTERLVVQEQEMAALRAEIADLKKC